MSSRQQHHHRRHRKRPPAYANDVPSALDDADQDVHILLLGDRGTGKTCLNARFVLGQFANTGDAAQLVGGHKLVSIAEDGDGEEKGTAGSSSTTESEKDRSKTTQVHLTVQDFPCGPCQATADNAVPPGGILPTGDFIYATLQTDYRLALLMRADAVMLVCNPWSRASFTWLTGEDAEPVEEGKEKREHIEAVGSKGIVHEVLEAARRKYFTRRIELLLDSIMDGGGSSSSSSSSTPDSRDTVKSEEKQAPQITIRLPGEDTQRQPSPSKRMEKNSPRVDIELEYPVLVVGTASDRLRENGGDLPRQVWPAEGQALARQFMLGGGGGGGGGGDEEDGLQEGLTSLYMEVSARTGENIDEAYRWLIQQVLRQRARAQQRRQSRSRSWQAAKEAERRRQRRTCGYWGAAAAQWLLLLPPPDEIGQQSNIKTATAPLVAAAQRLAEPAIRWFQALSQADIPEQPAFMRTDTETTTATTTTTTGTTMTTAMSTSSTLLLVPRLSPSSTALSAAAGERTDVARAESSMTNARGRPTTLHRQERSQGSSLSASDYYPAGLTADAAAARASHRDTDTGTDETASVPSLVVDNLSLDYISIPDSYLFPSPVGSPISAAGPPLGVEMTKDARPAP